jgi:magnesium transporter
MSRDDASFSALERLLKEGSDDDVKRLFHLLRPPDLADLVEATPEEYRTRVIRLMGAPLAAEVLREVEEAEREDILEDLSGREIAEIVPELRSDDATDIIDSLPPDKAARTLQRLPHEERAEIEALLGYGEDTAGGIMQSEIVKVPSDLSVGQAIQAVREADIEDVGDIHEVFVVDRDGRLLGQISPADLLHEDSAAPVRAVAEPNPISVPVTMDQEEIAELVREHDLATVPVVDENRVLVGQILHDDIADVIEEEATEDIARMAGADPEELYHDEIWKAVKSRVAWLLPPFVGGTLVATLMGGAGAANQSKIVAAYLVVVVGMAGGVGAQNAAITVRSLALGRIELRRAWRVIYRQVATGMILGALYGLMLFAFALVKQGTGSWHESMAVGVAVLASMSSGALMGVFVPLALERLGKDPAVGASPFIQTANDVVGACILIWVAKAMGL